MGLLSNLKVQKFCIWCGPIMLFMYFGFFWGVAGWIPPTPPSWNAEQIAQFYAENRTRIQVGQIGAMVGSVFLFPYWTVISAYIARIEKFDRGQLPVLAGMQWAGAILLQVLFILCSMLWIIACFRPELEPSSIRLLHDTGWLLFVMAFPGFVMQLFCLGFAGLNDDSPDPVWPRWASYFNLWVGLSGAGGAIAVFFKQGPFAYNGVIGFYLAAGVFAIWIAPTTHLMLKHVNRQIAVQGERTGDLAAVALSER